MLNYTNKIIKSIKLNINEYIIAVFDLYGFGRKQKLREIHPNNLSLLKQKEEIWLIINNDEKGFENKLFC